MKILKFTLLLFVALTLSNCMNSLPPSDICDIILKIENKEHKNLVTGIAYDDRTGMKWGSDYDYDMYDASFKIELPDVNKNDKHWGIKAGVRVPENNDQALSITIFTPYKEYPESVVFNIISPYIFGDKTARTMTAHFGDTDGNRVCTLISFNGRDYATYADSDNSLYRRTLITID